MVAAKAIKPVSLEEFIEFALRPENSNREFELIYGEIIEALYTTTYRSQIALLVGRAVQSYCNDHHLNCHISGAMGAYNVQGHVLLPKFAYKRTRMSDHYPDPEPPLWVADIISLNDKADDIRAKRDIYMKAGILRWEIYVPIQQVDVYAPDQPARTLGINDTLDGGDVLPGFELPVKDLFSATSQSNAE